MQLAQVLKLKLNIDDSSAFVDLTCQYMLACDYISRYVFEHDFEMNSVALSKVLYTEIRELFMLKSQMAQSAIRTVTARYKTVDTQLKKKPLKFQCDGRYYYSVRDIRWLTKSIRFSRPQADLVRNRDYSFVDGGNTISINTLGSRVKTSFDVPESMRKFLDGTWQFGTAKLVSLKGSWYLHISVTKEVQEFSRNQVRHVVGIDRGLRFISTAFDDKQHTSFAKGKSILAKRRKFDRVRAELQAKGTRSAKRALKRISGRENRWMSDVNHTLSKALIRKYGAGTVFILENLEDISTDERNLRGARQSHDIRNWTFYDLETKLTYKALESGSTVVKVAANYTSQRCPRCGTIRKENRDHVMHEYRCNCCGFRTNDDRVGAMNLYYLGTEWVSGNDTPSFATE